MSEELQAVIRGGLGMSENGEVKGSYYRAEVIAQLFGVSVRRIQQLTQEGVINTTKVLDGGRSVLLKRGTVHEVVRPGNPGPSHRGFGRP